MARYDYVFAGQSYRNSSEFHAAIVRANMTGCERNDNETIEELLAEAGDAWLVSEMETQWNNLKGNPDYSHAAAMEAQKEFREEFLARIEQEREAAKETEKQQEIETLWDNNASLKDTIYNAGSLQELADAIYAWNKNLSELNFYVEFDGSWLKTPKLDMGRIPQFGGEKPSPHGVTDYGDLSPISWDHERILWGHISENRVFIDLR